MDQNKGLSAIGYLSFYFMPFILPLIVFFVAKDSDVKRHNKRAAISHAIPFVLGIIYLAVFLYLTMTATPGPDVSFRLEGALLISFVILFILGIAIAIWNVVQAIKVLQ